MGEGPWDLWRGEDSLLNRLINGKSARLEGTGILELEEDETSAQESGAPRGPGQVEFALLCDFEEFKSPRTRGIEVRVQSRDDTAFHIIRGGYDLELSFLPRYQLSGSIPAGQREIPILMDAVTVGAGGLAPIGIAEGEKTVTRIVPVGNVTVGTLSSIKDLGKCKIVVPNFADEATVEGAGVKIALKEISPEVTQDLYTSESRGKVQPGSCLEVQRLQEDANDGVELAVEDFGWLLSFYAGRRIHPIAWEGETDGGTVWRIYAEQLITPLDEQEIYSCVNNVVPLHYFLQHAWRAWQSLSEEQRTRLRGAINFYADMLSTTYPTQRLAFTAMYLERFRDLMLGSSTLLEATIKDQKKVDKMAKRVRRTLRDSVEDNKDLSADEKDRLVEVANKVGPGHINNLFRRTFKEALSELLQRADLEIEAGQLGRFIRERDSVIHGSWDSGREGTLETYRLAEYGLNLLEMLLLRLFEYEGEYYDRASGSTQYFPAGNANWR